MKRPDTKILRSRDTIKLVLIIIAGFVIGYLVRGFVTSIRPATDDSDASASAENEERWWTCSMHPEIRQPKAGKCPKCFMDLIPVEAGSGEIGAREITFSEEALKLMEVQTTAVERKFAEAEIRLVGKIDYDETRLKHITAWVPGRIDELYVDFTGTQVIKGDHMVYLYSPELISAQAEFLQAANSAQNIKADSSELIKRSTQAIFEASSEKLRLLGLTEEQIENIKETGQPTDHITIYAPIGGVVIEKHVTEGTYVQTGTRIYTIADLSQLWVQLDAYESDMMWIRYGQEVEFTTEAYPGEVFTGRISFISPTVDSKTRTIKVRVNVVNLEGKLKPNMFVRAVVRSEIASGGMVMDSDMAGKWICPMHPSVVKNEAGQCDICRMDLVTTESLGYVKAQFSEHAPLVIPAAAPLITGTRAVVYVRKAGIEKPTFEGREVVLGPRAGDYYLVKEGLAEGDFVVSKGNFKIDSALQIQARPSMMSPDGGGGMTGHNHGAEQQHKPKEPEKYLDKLPQFKK